MPAVVTKKKRGRPKKIKEPHTHPTEYFLQLEVGGQLYFGDGLSMLEALHNLEQPAKIVTKGVLHIRVGDRKRARPMIIPQMKRLFFPIAQVVIAKQLEQGF
jgi:hypothetical protein